MESEVAKLINNALEADLSAGQMARLSGYIYDQLDALNDLLNASCTSFSSGSCSAFTTSSSWTWTSVANRTVSANGISWWVSSTAVSTVQTPSTEQAEKGTNWSTISDDCWSCTEPTALNWFTSTDSSGWRWAKRQMRDSDRSQSGPRSVAISWRSTS